MAADTTFAKRFMLEHERSALRGVTLETGFVLTQEQSAASFNTLWASRAAAFDRPADVWVVAISATHFAFQNRMVMRHLEFCAHFQVTLETCVRRATRIDDLAFLATGRDVETSRTVTAFASHFLGVVARRF